MPGSGILTLSGTIVGLPTGQATINIQYVLPAAIESAYEITLGAGDNTFIIPQGTTLVIVQPPPGNTVAVSIKGLGDPLGLALHPLMPLIYPIGAGQATITLTAVSVPPGPHQITFF